MSFRSDTNGTYAYTNWPNPALFSGATQAFLHFWLKVGTWTTGADSLIGFVKTNFANGGWTLNHVDGSDTLSINSFGAGGIFANAIPAPMAGQGWMAIGFHFTHVSGADDTRAYKNGVVNGTIGHLTNDLVGTAADVVGASNHTSIKLAELAIWTASDGSLTSTVAQALATALAAGTLPSATTPAAGYYAPALSDFVNLIG